MASSKSAIVIPCYYTGAEFAEQLERQKDVTSSIDMLPRVLAKNLTKQSPIRLRLLTEHGVTFAPLQKAASFEDNGDSVARCYR